MITNAWLCSSCNKIEHIWPLDLCDCPDPSFEHITYIHPPLGGYAE